MGSELCNGHPDDIDEKEQINPDDEIPEDEINKIIRIGKPTTEIAYNINDLPQDLKESKELTKIQQKINKMIAHEKRHKRPLTIGRAPSEQNKLPDPYYMRWNEAIYIGEWVFDKQLLDHVPGGVGRLYSNDQIIEGQLKSFSMQTQIIGTNNIAQTMIGHSKEKSRFFSIVKEAKKINSADMSMRSGSKIEILLDGQGRKFTRNSEYSGFFVHGLLFGKGYCRIKQQEDLYEYTGQFKQSKKCGKGIEKFKLTTYDGDFQNDKKNGKGTLTLLISRTYQRERLDEQIKNALQDKEKDPALKVNFVTLFLKQRLEFQNMLQDVIKQLKWVAPNYNFTPLIFNVNFLIEHHRKTKFLEHYKGDFVNDLFHGQGMYTWFNGKTYSGSWQDGKMDGLGQFYWPNGSYYKGEYEKDMKHGKGEMVWSLSKRFRGSWLYSLRHGYGELIEVQKNEEKTNDSQVPYYVHVKGALWNKDRIEKEFFDVVLPLNYDLQKLIFREKQMIAMIKDIKI